MKYIIAIVLLLVSCVAYGQAPKAIQFANGNTNDTANTRSNLTVAQTVRFPFYSNSNPALVLSVNSVGQLVLIAQSGGGGTTDTTSLSRRIDSSVKYRDTLTRVATQSWVNSTLASLGVTSTNIGLWNSAYRFSSTFAVSSPLTYSGNTVGIQAASGSQAGALSAADFAAFAAKQNALGFTPENVANKVQDLNSPNANTYISTAGINTSLLPYLLKSDTSSLSNRINLKLNSSDTAGLSVRINLKLNSSDTAGLSGRINLKLNSSDTAGLSGRINLKQNTITLTTTGSSGPATLVGSTLNIPQYSGANYTASGYLGLTGGAFYADTSGRKLATQTMLTTDSAVLAAATATKQPQLNGTGFVKAAGTTISYDNTAYYPASNPNGYTSNAGTVTSVGAIAGTGISITGSTSPITGAGTYTFTNTSPDQTVTIASGSGVSVTGSYPAYTVSATGGTGTVTSVNVVSANGFAGTVANPTTTPAIAITTTVNGLVKGNGTALSPAIAGTDYQAAGTYLTSYSVTPANGVTGTNTGTSTAPVYTYSLGNITPASVTTGSVSGTSLSLRGSTSGTLNVTPAAAVTSYTWIPPSAIATTTGQVIQASAISGGTVTTTWATPAGGGGTPGGSTTQIQYNNAGSFGGASNGTIAADGNMVLLSQTVTPTTPTSGVKVYSNNMTGIDDIHVIPSVGPETVLQSALGQKIYGYLVPGLSTGNLSGNFGSGSFSNTPATVTNVSSTYSATNALPNYTYLQIAAPATTNTSAESWSTGAASGSIVGGTSFRLMSTFAFPAYVSTERIFSGYFFTGSAIGATFDPSSLNNIIGVGKDASDATLQFMFNNGSVTATKINTGVTPNQNDIYRVTVFVPANGLTSYVTLEVITKTTITSISASNTAKIPALGTKMYSHVLANTAAVSATVSIGILCIYEEKTIGL